MAKNRLAKYIYEVAKVNLYQHTSYSSKHS